MLHFQLMLIHPQCKRNNAFSFFLLFSPLFAHKPLMNDKQTTQFIETKQADTDKFEPCRVQVTSVEQTLLMMILLLLITSRFRHKKKRNKGRFFFD